MTKLAATPLYDLHQAMNAKMVSFAGYQMPIKYPEGIIHEHKQTRSAAGLFDVSHMGQVRVTGANCCKELEKLVPVDLEALAIGQQTYALFTNDRGGILDDLMILRLAEAELLLVVNAACKEADIAHLKAALEPQLQIEVLDDRALVALQGPAAKRVIEKACPEAAELFFMQGCESSIFGEHCYITRSGYTGEDGFEISLPAVVAKSIAEQLLAFEDVELIGLGARDSLRLEAGLCLYGHDITTSTTPIEAGLQWSISRSRRTGGVKEGGFPGADIILPQMTEGVSRLRVGLKVEGRLPVREGATIFTSEDQAIGSVTSGGFSPMLNAPIAMAYVSTSGSLYKEESLHVSVRGRKIPVEIAKLPIVKPNYHRKPKAI